VPIPTNGANSFFFNSHAATEGVLSRSADRRLLVFAGYGGVNLLAIPGTPSLLDIQRGFCTVDAAGAINTLLYKPAASEEKINPRGAASDGTNFWGCGNAGATLYFTPAASKAPVEFASVENTRAMKIINHALYATLNGPDGIAMESSAGIYQFVDAAGAPLPLPLQADAKIQLVVPAAEAYVKISGFDLNPDKTIAYTADTGAGIQKYVKSGTGWKLAYNFAIPRAAAVQQPGPRQPRLGHPARHCVSPWRPPTRKRIGGAGQCADLPEAGGHTQNGNHAGLGEAGGGGGHAVAELCGAATGRGGQFSHSAPQRAGGWPSGHDGFRSGAGHGKSQLHVSAGHAAEVTG
jgi:hypothetical protein